MRIKHLLTGAFLALGLTGTMSVSAIAGAFSEKAITVMSIGAMYNPLDSTGTTVGDGPMLLDGGDLVMVLSATSTDGPPAHYAPGEIGVDLFNILVAEIDSALLPAGDPLSLSAAARAPNAPADVGYYFANGHMNGLLDDRAPGYHMIL